MTSSQRVPSFLVLVLVVLLVPPGRYAVAISQGNAQAALAFQFLHEVVKVLKNYFGDFTEVRAMRSPPWRATRSQV